MPKFRVEFTRAHRVVEDAHVYVEAKDQIEAEHLALTDLAKNPSGFEWRECASEVLDEPALYSSEEVHDPQA